MALEKELEILQKNILLEKGCDFSKSLEPNTVLSYKIFAEILKYFTKPSKLKVKYVHLNEKSALLLRSITAVC